jgi:hypothetical protein
MSGGNSSTPDDRSDVSVVCDAVVIYLPVMNGDNDCSVSFIARDCDGCVHIGDSKSEVLIVLALLQLVVSWHLSPGLRIDLYPILFLFEVLL